MKMKKIASLLGCAFVILILVLTVTAQVEKLNVNQEKILNLHIGEEKSFSLNLKKGDYAEIFWKVDNDAVNKLNPDPDFALYTPSGKDLSKIIRNVFEVDSIPFVAPENGEYKLVVKFENHDEPKKMGEFKVSLNYKDRFAAPANAIVRGRRKINGYDLKIIGMTSNPGSSYFIIEKNKKIQYVLKGDDGEIMGFYFADDMNHAFDAEERRSTLLMKNTPDKTGDGTPDVALEYYSGGAHCCFDLLFFELGNTVKPVDVLSTGDTRTVATGKNPKGGLRLKTGDSTFAYWLVSFASSPIPQVVLDFKNGAFRPNLEAMKKPAPSMAVLQRKANAAKKEINLKPYTGEDFLDSFVDAFWGEMLDLMYAGHEDLAWKYLDMVWDPRKPGKELFVRDFKAQLAKSEFWQMMQEDKSKK